MLQRYSRKMLDLKTLSLQDYREVFARKQFILEPRWHQYVSLSFGIDKDRIFYFHDVGTGKTITALYMMLLWKCRHILVICTRSAFPAWVRDIKQATKCNFAIIEGSKDNRLTLLGNNCTISIVNYEGLKTLYADKLDGGWMINRCSFIHNFDGLIADEVHHLNNTASLQSIIARELSIRAHKVIGMTGTEIDSSLLELWHMYYFLDGGATFGNNFWSFRNTHFWHDKYRKWLWHVKDFSDTYILTRAGISAIAFDRDECEDLPPKDEIVRYVRTNQQYLNLQQSIAEDDYITLDGVRLENSSTPTKGHRLAQLPSGFIYIDNAAQESRRVFELEYNPKIECLIDILTDTSDQVVIFHGYTHEAVLIERALKKAKISYASIRGGIKDPNAEHKKFFSGKKRVMVAQKIAGGESYDFTNARIAIYYSAVASPKIRTQTIGRIHRDGQKHKILIIDLALERSIDERTNNNRAERKRFIDTVREFLKELKQ